MGDGALPAGPRLLLAPAGFVASRRGSVRAFPAGGRLTSKGKRAGGELHVPELPAGRQKETQICFPAVGGACESGSRGMFSPNATLVSEGPAGRAEGPM